jgi:hypothetical protein
MSLSPKKTISKVRFLLDENVDVRLSVFLEERGFAVSFSPKGLKNGAVLALAKKTSSVLLTNDKDFANPDLFDLPQVSGIVVFVIHPPTLPKLKLALTRFLKKIPPGDFSGKTFLVSEEGIEIRTTE